MSKDMIDTLTVTMPRYLWYQVMNALEHQQQHGVAYDGMTDGATLDDWQQDRLNKAIEVIVDAWRYSD